MMPRLTPLRAVLFLPLCYLFLVFLWVALPSPASVNDSNAETYYQRALTSGSTLTTVYENSRDFFSARNPDYYSLRDGVAIDWTLIPNFDQESLLLQVGTTTVLNLTHYAGLAAPYTDPHIFETTGRAGEGDGVNLPWFSFADATLLFFDIHHDPQEIDLRVVVPQVGTVEVWFNSPYHSLDQENWSRNLCLCTISNIPLKLDSSTISQLRVDDMTRSVPSQTFVIRHTIIQLLAPVTLAIIPMVDNLVMPVFSNVVSPIFMLISWLVSMSIIGTLCWGVLVVLCWLGCGRPPFHEWKKSFWMTRWLKDSRRKTQKTIWGPAGPLHLEDADEHDHDHDHGRPEPMPLRNALDFVRSKRPMDDLFVTFQCTKWMIGPLRSRHRVDEEHFNDSISDGVNIKETS